MSDAPRFIDTLLTKNEDMVNTMGNARFAEISRLMPSNKSLNVVIRLRMYRSGLRVNTHSLYGWIKRYAAPSASVGMEDQASKIRRLKQELTRVTRSVISLKSHRVFRLGSKVRYAVAAEHLPLFSIRAMCRMLHVHPSGFDV